jgi:transposase
MQRLGLPGILDNHLQRHGLQQGLSWGWFGTIWLAHILTQSNPRKQPVQIWVRQAQAMIERITGMKVKELDFTDDWLTLLLRRLSKPETWQSIETELTEAAQAVLTYREEWLIERGFHRLKGVPLSLNPLFAKRDDQVVGLTNLLSLAIRFLTLIEFVVRCKLKQNQEKWSV